MEIKQLMTFQKAAEQLNFTRTAEQLNFAQSSVTGHIKSLEDELGVPLFDRLGKSLKLTEAGRTLLHYANRIIRLTSEAGQAISEEKGPAGLLVIGTSESLCTYRLPPVLSAFSHRYPKVRFHFLPDTSDRDIIKLLAGGKMDAAVLMDAGNDLRLFNICPLQREKIVLVASADHQLATLRSVGPEELYKEPLLLTEKDCSYRRNLDRILSSNQLIPEQVSEFASVEAIKQCVISGLGVAALPEMTVHKEILDGTIKVLPWTGDPMHIQPCMVWLKDKWVSPALSAFLTLTQQHLQN